MMHDTQVHPHHPDAPHCLCVCAATTWQQFDATMYSDGARAEEALEVMEKDASFFSPPCWNCVEEERGIPDMPSEVLFTQLTGLHSCVIYNRINPVNVERPAATTSLPVFLFFFKCSATFHG